jgi:hypothetical protein
VDEWRAALTRQVAHARQIIGKLLVGKLTLMPEPRNCQNGFRFSGIGMIEKLIARVTPGRLSTLHTLASPTGFDHILRADFRLILPAA